MEHTKSKIFIDLLLLFFVSWLCELAQWVICVIYLVIVAVLVAVGVGIYFWVKNLGVKGFLALDSNGSECASIGM